jgi:GxxExxY protein
MDHREHGEHRESAELDALTGQIVDAGFQVHKELGPGLFETTYETCLAFELQSRGLTVRRQVALPVVYKGIALDAGYKLDLLVEEQIVLEIKAIDALARVHEAQILTYLKLSGRRVGFLMNFNVALFKNDIRRFAL